MGPNLPLGHWSPLWCARPAPNPSATMLRTRSKPAQRQRYSVEATHREVHQWYPKGIGGLGTSSPPSTSELVHVFPLQILIPGWKNGNWSPNCPSTSNNNDYQKNSKSKGKFNKHTKKTINNTKTEARSSFSRHNVYMIIAAIARMTKGCGP